MGTSASPPDAYELTRATGALLWTAFDRYEQCDAACAYHLRGPKQKVHFSAWWGIFVHRFLEYAQTKGREAALKYVGGKRLKGLFDCCSRIDVNALPEGQVELGRALDPITGEHAEVMQGAKVPENFQHGRLDVLSELERCPHITDYKTGEIDHINPGESPQLLGAMLAVRASWQDPWELAMRGGERPRAYFVSLAKVNRDGSVRFRTAKLEDAHLDNFHQRARRIQLKVLHLRQRVDHGDRIEFQAGPACGSCPISVVCPAVQKA
jgi:hypothetical protein